MPAKYDRCIKKIEEKIKKGIIPKTYKTQGGNRKKSNAYAICFRARKKK